MARWAGVVAMFACLAGAASLGVRTVSSLDIGYHLAYGLAFLDTGQLVDDSSWVYTVPARAGQGWQAGHPPGPGCWYDDAGRYRFPNANWLSQVIFALAYRAAGWAGLSVLGACVVFGIFGVSAYTMRRCGVGPAWTGLALLLIAQAGYERLNLRPELLGYLILAGQLAAVLPIVMGRARLTLARAVLVVALQLLLVNIHSYWLLGLGIIGAATAESLLRLIWPGLRSESKKITDAQAAGDQAQQAKTFAVMLGVAILMSLANPWTWRIAALPFQTLAFFRQHHLTSLRTGPGAHPWSTIGELYPTLDSAFTTVSWRATLGFKCVLGLAGLGGLAAIFTRRWTAVFLLPSFAVISLTIRRNIALGAIMLLPISLASLASLRPKLPRAKLMRLPRGWLLAWACVPIVLSAWLIASVVTNRFYFNERRAERFALGPCKTTLPISAAAWLNEHKPAGPVWTDCDISSNLHFLTVPHRPLPILTNTWAYPPRILANVLDAACGRVSLAELERAYNIQIVAIRLSSFTAGRGPGPEPTIVQQLIRSRNFSLMHLGVRHAVFLRNTGPNAELAKRYALWPATFSAEDFIARARRLDPISAYPLQLAAVSLQRLGWYDKSIEVFQAVVAAEPDYHEAWFEMGASYAIGAQQKWRKGLKKQAYEDFRQAQACFLRCLKINPNYKYAKQNLLQVNRDLLNRQVGNIGKKSK